jgi:hypothetical protein
VQREPAPAKKPSGKESANSRIEPAGTNILRFKKTITELQKMDVEDDDGDAAACKPDAATGAAAMDKAEVKTGDGGADVSGAQEPHSGVADSPQEQGDGFTDS